MPRCPQPPQTPADDGSYVPVPEEECSVCGRLVALGDDDTHCPRCDGVVCPNCWEVGCCQSAVHRDPHARGEGFDEYD